jgi:hypothetical protein
MIKTITSSTASVLDGGDFVATAGVKDTPTVGTVNGLYRGGFLIDTGDGNDSVTVGTTTATQNPNTWVSLGTGNDVLVATNTGFLVNGSRYEGGAGVDTLRVNTTSAVNFSTTAVGKMFTGFEVLDLSNPSLTATVQTVTLSLADVLDFTTGNAVAGLLRIDGAGGDILNLRGVNPLTVSTPANLATQLNVDGVSYTVAASTLGDATANDVTIGGNTYDVYNFAYANQTLSLLVQIGITTNHVL